MSAPRVCHCGCGESIEHLAPQSRYLNAAHRKSAQRRRDREEARRQLDVEAQRDAGQAERTRFCNCGGFPLPNSDGDLICVNCTHPVSRNRGRVNGFDKWDRLMRTDADGQPYSFPHPRLADVRRWQTRPSR